MPFQTGPNIPAGGSRRRPIVSGPKTGRDQNSFCKNFAAKGARP
jgi:hypothetical protein